MRIEKLKQLFLNGPGALVTACALTWGAYGIGCLLRPFVDLLTELACAAVLVGLVAFFAGVAWIGRQGNPPA
jgi:hypothetical protein